jgi:hypothetical protein
MPSMRLFYAPQASRSASLRPVARSAAARIDAPTAAPAIGTVPGSFEFGAKYTGKYGPINNYAASSDDSGRVLMAAIAEATKEKQGLPTRADVVAALRKLTFQASRTPSGCNGPRRATTSQP